MSICYVCKQSGAQVDTRNYVNYVNCPRCGTYKLDLLATQVLSTRELDQELVAKASGWLRENPEHLITQDELLGFNSLKTPSVAERALRLLKHYAKLTTALGATVVPGIDDELAISWSQNNGELRFLKIQYLQEEQDFIEVARDNSVIIKPKGFAFLNQLASSNPESVIGFCAMWFDETIRFLWTDCIQVAIHAAGYDPKRIDSHQHNNRIDDEIISQIRLSKFVVADFTKERGGVYFEAGFALGLGLPVIWTCKKDLLDSIHFDTRQYNFILWEEDKLDEFKKVLQLRIEATLGQGPLVKST